MRNLLGAALVALSLVALAGPWPSRGEDALRTPADRRPAAITLSFKLDPRLAGATYGGERWVSPRTYTGAAAQDTVEVKAMPVDAHGRTVSAGLEWASSSPDVVTVAPAAGPHVRLAVKREGEGTVTVRSGAALRKLAVKAVLVKGAWQVSIAQ